MENKGLEALKVLVMSSTTIFNTKEQIEESVKTVKKELKEHEQHKAIEQELGIDLQICGKALVDGIHYCNAIDYETKKPVSFGKVYIVRVDKKERIIFAFLPKKGKVDMQTGISECLLILLPFDNYKKKGLYGWALTKEELEK